MSDFTVTPEHSSFTRFLWPFILGMDGVHPSITHIPFLDSNFSRVHCTVDVGGFPYIRALCVAIGGVIGAVVAAFWGGALQALLGTSLPEVPIGPVLLFAARVLAFVAVVAASLRASAACSSRGTAPRLIKFALFAALAALVCGYVPAADGVRLGLSKALSTVGGLVPQLAGLEGRKVAMPLEVVGAAGGVAVGRLIASALLKAPYYFYVGRKAL